MNTIFRIGLATILIGITSCQTGLSDIQKRGKEISLRGADLPLGPQRKNIEDDLKKAKTLWKSHNIESYNYIIAETECYCLFGPSYGPNRVYVENNLTKRIIYLGENRDGFRNRDNLKPDVGIDSTVPELFDLIELILSTGEDDNLVRITFDRTYGFPTEISRDEPMIADEEFRTIIYKFKPL